MYSCVCVCVRARARVRVCVYVCVVFVCLLLCETARMTCAAGYHGLPWYTVCMYSRTSIALKALSGRQVSKLKTSRYKGYNRNVYKGQIVSGNCSIIPLCGLKNLCSVVCLYSPGDMNWSMICRYSISYWYSLFCFVKRLNTKYQITEIYATYQIHANSSVNFKSLLLLSTSISVYFLLSLVSCSRSFSASATLCSILTSTSSYPFTLPMNLITLSASSYRLCDTYHLKLSGINLVKKADTLSNISLSLMSGLMPYFL